MTEVTFETRKKVFFLIKWSFFIPRLGCSTESKWFLVNGNNWKLKLYAGLENGRSEIWTMQLLLNTKENIPPKFPLTVYIRDKEKDYFLFQKEITSHFNDIWSSSRVSFLKSFPDIQIAGNNTLLFIFDFHFETLDQEIPVKVHKSVQTSDPVAWDKYLDEIPCLENLSLDLRKLLDESSDPNVQLKCGDLSIGAHKLILGARSEVFRNMMESDMLEGREGTVEIVDIEPRVFEVLIRYMYTGILPGLTEDTALPLYEAADKYQVEALRKRTGRFLSKILSQDNALRILAVADAHSDKDLKGRVVSYILDEKIPSRDEQWTSFCNDYPKLANEVLNRAYKLSSCS